jgi:diguanylate cyclase (GGDEF)-like protein
MINMTILAKRWSWSEGRHGTPGAGPSPAGTTKSVDAHIILRQLCVHLPITGTAIPLPSSDQSERNMVCIMKITDQTLLEQMKISDHEIERRKDMFDITDDLVETLAACKPMMVENLDTVTEAFYTRQIEFSEIALTIGDADTLQRLKQSMRRYITELFEGYYDSEYVNKRLRVGKVHKQIGVTPKLYVSAVGMLQSNLTDIINNCNETSCKLGKEGPSGCEKVKKAISKMLLFDIHLVFETYIGTMMAELQSAKEEVEIYAKSLEQKVAERTKQLQDLSVKDPLTNLFNQRAFYDYLRRDLMSAERQKRPLSLVYLDLNGFKGLNDTKGHKEGDALLVRVAETLFEVVRETDIPCRYGGDEFCVLMPEAPAEEAKKFVERLSKAFDEKVTHGVTFSTGIAQTGPDEFCTMDELVKKADTLMYKSKAKSKKQPGHYVSLGH